ncbi:MAG: hypothetical protein FGM22_07260 [Burkholderiaceae bacterium]|nr:hypothetical protein [Burkholderiaceae bacterium]
MSWTIDIHPVTITVDRSDERSWTGTVRTPDDQISGEFPYGHIEDADTYGYQFFMRRDDAGQPIVEVR